MWDHSRIFQGERLSGRGQTAKCRARENRQCRPEPVQALPALAGVPAPCLGLPLLQEGLEEPRRSEQAVEAVCWASEPAVAKYFCNALGTPAVPEILSGAVPAPCSERAFPCSDTA